jgi:hypothetical protein
VPGFPQGDDAAKLNTLKPIPVIMAVGELDTVWRNAMQETKAQLESLGWPLSLTVVPGDDHILRHLDTVKLWAQIDSFRAPRRQ